MQRIILILCLFAIAGCSASSADIGPAPTNYRQIAKDYVKASFFDPYSVRDAEIAPPKPMDSPAFIPTSIGIGGTFESAWVICMRANAKNRMGGYVGLRETAIVVKADRVIHAYDEPMATSYICDGARYEPFPEATSA